MKSTRNPPDVAAYQPVGGLGTGKFAIILAVLIVALFPGALFAGKTFVFRDFGIFTYPNASFLHDSFWRGEMPLWNPFNNCGIPFLAQWNMAALYPLSLLYVVLPVGLGLNWFVLDHLFIAGMGMYWLARKWTNHHFGAALAAVAFTFNGMTLNCVMWTSNLAGLAWMPWVVLVVEQAWLLGGRRIALAALMGAMQMLTGAAEIIVFTWVIIFCLFGLRLTADGSAWLRTVMRTLAVVGIVTLLSAAQLLPFLDLLSHSIRDNSYSTDLWSIPLWGWANLILPLYHCYPARLGVFFQPGQDWTSSYYLGAGSLNLALLALILSPKPRQWVLGGIAIIGFWLALGNPGLLYGTLHKVLPALSLMQFPVKFVILATFIIPLLAAIAVAEIKSRPGAKNHPHSFGLILGAMMLTLALIGGLLWQAHAQPFPYQQWPALWKNGLWRSLFFLLFAGTILLYTKTSTVRRQTILEWLLLMVVWADFATHVPWQNPMVDASVYDPGLSARRFEAAPKLGESRAMLLKATGDFVAWHELGDPQNDFLGYRCALIGDCNLLDGIPLADGFYAVLIREQYGLFEKFYLAATNQILAPGFADFLAISQISDPKKFLAWQERPSHLPFYSIGARPEYIGLSKMPKLLLDPNFNPRNTVYLPLEASGLNITNPAQATAHATHFTAQREEFEVDADAPAWLVLSQTYYHPWAAYVNGQPVKIWRANYAYQGIPIPPGKSQVRLVYQDRLFQCGAVAAAITLVGCLIVLRPRGSGRRGIPEA
jgi:hypothetical protein